MGHRLEEEPMARPPRGSRPPLTRAVVLEEARALLREEGPSGLSLRKLAARIGVTAPALYAHVEGKDALLAAIAQEEFVVLTERFVALDIADPVARMRAQAQIYVDHARSRPALFDVMFLYRPEWPAQEVAPSLPAASKAFDVAFAAVQDAHATGRIVIDPLVASLALWAAVHGLATLLAAGPGFDPATEATLVETTIDAMLRGLTTDPSPDPT